jgi:hypothetical protein
VTITSKCRSSGESAASSKKQRKSIALEKKLDVFEKYEHNKCVFGIAYAMGIPKST